MRFCHRCVLQQGQDGTPLPRENVLKMAAGVQLEGAGDALALEDGFRLLRGDPDLLHPGIFRLLLPVPQG
jgi:hypothetical protein